MKQLNLSGQMSKRDRAIEGWHDYHRGITKNQSHDKFWLEGWDKASKGYGIEARVLASYLNDVRAI